MKRILIIGNSIAGIKAAEEIRHAEPSTDILIFSLEKSLAYDRTLFPALLADEVNQDRLLYRTQKDLEAKAIRLCTQGIERINFKRSRVLTEKREQIDYDYLLVNDTPFNDLPDLKGTNKTGVFAPRRMCDVTQILEALPLTETVLIQSETLRGLKMACALAKRKKEVLWVFPSKQILPSLLDEESAGVLQRLVEACGVRVMPENSIAEILGDSDAKAVRLKSSKVFSTEMVLFPDAPADLKWFKETELRVDCPAGGSAGGRVAVDGYFQTNIANVFVMDSICNFGDVEAYDDYNLFISILEDQGRVVAGRIRGEGVPMRVPLKVSSFTVNDTKINLIEKTTPGPITEIESDRDDASGMYIKIFKEAGRVSGAVLVNCEQKKEAIISSLAVTGEAVTAKPEQSLPVQEREPVAASDDTSNLPK